MTGYAGSRRMGAKPIFFLQFVRGAKPRADLVIARTVPHLDAKKRRNSVPFVPMESVCCTCVPGLLPPLQGPRDCLEIGGAGVEAVVSRLISDRGWMRGLDCEVGENWG